MAGWRTESLRNIALSICKIRTVQVKVKEQTANLSRVLRRVHYVFSIGGRYVIPAGTLRRSARRDIP